MSSEFGNVPEEEICKQAKKDRLARIISDHLAAEDSALKREEIGVLNSVLEASLPNLKKDTVRSITHKLAAATATSPTLAVRLASQPASISAPFLELSPALRQDDLLKIAREKGQDHLMAISRRDLLNRDLTHELLRRGNREVRRAVICNLGADVSPEDFERYAAEIPIKMGYRIGHLRKSNARLVQDLLKSDMDIVVGPELEKRTASIPIDGWVRTICAGKAVIDRALAQLCMEKNLLGIVTLLSEMSGLPHKHVMHLMVRFDATGLAMVCRSLGVSPLEYSTLSRLRCAHIRLPSSTKCLWTANYNVLEIRDARRFLKLLTYKIKFEGPEALPVTVDGVQRRKTGKDPFAGTITRSTENKRACLPAPTCAT